MKRQLALICASLCIVNAIHAQEGQQGAQKEVQAENSAAVQTTSAPTNPDKNEAQASVIIASMKNPALKPYRIMAAGMDAYDENKQLAPNAPLYFKLSRRKAMQDTAPSWSEVKMRLASDEESKRIPIMDDGRFVLERNEKAYEENAELILNQKKALFNFRPDIRTPGLAHNVYRMGDQHLACKMEVDMVKKEIGFFFTTLVSTFLMKIDWCETKHQIFSFALNDWAISIKTIRGEQEVRSAFRGSRFHPEFWNKTISPDTLYEFELWSSLSKERQQEVVDQQQFIIRTSDKKNPIKYPLVKNQQVYQTEIAITDKRFHFQIETDQGALAFANTLNAKQLELEQRIDLKLGEGTNYLQAPKSGLYRFTLDLADIAHPHFQVQYLGDSKAL